jgi:hypothetical protein
MRLVLILLLFSAACAVQGQSTNAPITMVPKTNSPASQSGQSMEAQTSLGGHGINLAELKPNELPAGRFIISGITVEAFKQRNLLQLINPLAPARYGSPDDNIVRDPTAHRTGLKIFALRF